MIQALLSTRRVDKGIVLAVRSNSIFALGSFNSFTADGGRESTQNSIGRHSSSLRPEVSFRRMSVYGMM